MIAAVAIAVVLSVPAGAYPAEGWEGDEEPPIQEKCEMLGRFNVSVYHFGGKHDGDPFITATGLDIRTLKPHETICAISEENLSRSGGPVEFGDRLTLVHRSKKMARVCTVEDAMSLVLRDLQTGELIPVTSFVDVLTTPDILEFWRDTPVFLCRDSGRR